MTSKRTFSCLAAAAAAAIVSLAAAMPAQAQSAAQVAVDAAKKYAGAEITIVWEAGLQSLDPLNFSGPKWEELTGIKVKVIEVTTSEMFTKILQEHRAGSGAYDALNVIPSWMPDLVRAGALEPLDSFVDKYGFRDELQNIAPTYRDNQMTVDGKIYGFPDDGDLFILYYRKDLFESPKEMAAFKAKYGYELGPPETWDQVLDIAAFFRRDTDGDGTIDMWGYADQPKRGRSFYWYLLRYAAYLSPDPALLASHQVSTTNE